MKHIGPYSRALLRGAIGDAVDGRSREGRFLHAYIERKIREMLKGSPR